MHNKGKLQPPATSTHGDCSTLSTSTGILQTTPCLSALGLAAISQRLAVLRSEAPPGPSSNLQQVESAGMVVRCRCRSRLVYSPLQHQASIWLWRRTCSRGLQCPHPASKRRMSNMQLKKASHLQPRRPTPDNHHSATPVPSPS